MWSMPTGRKGTGVAEDNREAGGKLVQVITQQRSQLSQPRQSVPRRAEDTEKKGPLCYFCKEKEHL